MLKKTPDFFFITALRNQLHRADDGLRTLEARMDTLKRSLRDGEERELELRRNSDQTHEKLQLVAEDNATLRTRLSSLEEECERLNVNNTRLSRTLAATEQSAKHSAQDVSGMCVCVCVCLLLYVLLSV